MKQEFYFKLQTTDTPEIIDMTVIGEGETATERMDDARRKAADRLRGRPHFGLYAIVGEVLR